jgi:hypothetical protein
MFEVRKINEKKNIKNSNFYFIIYKQLNSYG